MMIEAPQETSNRQDTVQRIQVGLVGLVAVLLLVSTANFVLQRASDEQSAIEEIQAQASGSARELVKDVLPAAAPAEPLAELGITPAPVSSDSALKPTQKKPGSRAQVVPDLEPDPKLEAPMDQE
ncbi:MAG: hypothetical protein V7676_01250 [Parasphingorhabdus sp.]|uniref:hypothetical protein n=1 Tax=Parasphingorhabdus sp. TaxID=2709688 RepID=UPI0030025494